MNESIPANPVWPSRFRRLRKLAIATSIALSCALPATTLGAPGDLGPAIATYQNVDYISAGSGAALDLGFPVLVPGWVPSPFGGEPSIDAGGGYYSLYWMNAGGDPTFLQVTGTVGGALPTGSPYDLNVELFINASVQGYDAIHDVTPAYDAVWWIAGGVLYKVESRNSGTDSLSLANSLITFVAPSAPEPEPTEPPVVEEPDPTSPPVVEEPAPSEPDPVDTGNQGGDSGSDSSGDNSGSESTANESSNESDTATNPGDASDGGSESSSVGDDEDAGVGGESAEPTPTPIYSDGTGGPFATSDGTGGARVHVIGSDGTGGTSDVVVLPTPANRAPTP